MILGLTTEYCTVSLRGTGEGHTYLCAEQFMQNTVGGVLLTMPYQYEKGQVYSEECGETFFRKLSHASSKTTRLMQYRIILRVMNHCTLFEALSVTPM